VFSVFSVFSVSAFGYPLALNRVPVHWDPQQDRDKHGCRRHTGSWIGERRNEQRHSCQNKK
jgi:hypothetical protein